MSTPIDSLVPPRETELMGLPIRRILPWRRRRQCGPFVFLDHMGPHTLAVGEGLDVPPHPHIGLATLTWLIEGSLDHRDSLGTEQRIRPGEVNWMTAGRGIVHSERTPFEERSRSARLEGLQFWVAQPEDSEAGEPRFEHAAATELPRWQTNHTDWVLVAGRWQQHRSPIRTDSELTLLDLRSRTGGRLVPPRPTPTWQWGLYLLSGDLVWNGTPVPVHHLRVSDQPVELHWQPGTHAVLFGGEPLGPRFMDWNFVASRPDLNDAAREAWQQRRFAPVPGDDGYVPYPGGS